MVTSAPVPAVVGNAMMGTDLFLVGAQPSRLTMSENSGLFATMPMPLAVSIDDPPPMAIRQSAPEALKAAIPSFTLVTVGFGLISL